MNCECCWGRSACGSCFMRNLPPFDTFTFTAQKIYMCLCSLLRWYYILYPLLRRYILSFCNSYFYNPLHTLMHTRSAIPCGRCGPVLSVSWFASVCLPSGLLSWWWLGIEVLETCFKGVVECTFLLMWVLDEQPVCLPVLLFYLLFSFLCYFWLLFFWGGGGAVWVLRLTLTCSTVRFYDSYQFTFLWAIIVMTVKFRHSFSYRKDMKQKVALWPMKIISLRLNDFTVVWDWVFSLLLDKWKKLHLKPRDPFVFTDLAIQLESSRFSQPAESRPRSMRHSHQNLGNLQMQSLWTRKVLCGSFLCAIYKFSFIHSFTVLDRQST